MYIDSLDLNHLFCHLKQTFWRDLQIFLATKNVNIDFNFEMVSFGKLDKVYLQCNTNFIIFSAKYFIFINKCNKTTPDISNYKQYLYKQINVEKQIAINKYKLPIHEQKWNNILIG